MESNPYKIYWKSSLHRDTYHYHVNANSFSTLKYLIEILLEDCNILIRIVYDDDIFVDDINSNNYKDKIAPLKFIDSVEK